MLVFSRSPINANSEGDGDMFATPFKTLSEDDMVYFKMANSFTPTIQELLAFIIDNEYRLGSVVVVGIAEMIKSQKTSDQFFLRAIKRWCNHLQSRFEYQYLANCMEGELERIHLDSLDI